MGRRITLVVEVTIFESAAAAEAHGALDKIDNAGDKRHCTIDDGWRVLLAIRGLRATLVMKYLRGQSK